MSRAECLGLESQTGPEAWIQGARQDLSGQHTLCCGCSFECDSFRQGLSSSTAPSTLCHLRAALHTFL